VFFSGEEGVEFSRFILVHNIFSSPLEGEEEQSLG